MNILKFIESFTDENLLNRKGSRRDSLSQFKSVGANAALAAMPLGIVSMILTPQDAKAVTATSADAITDALNLALTLEFLESKFFQTGLDTQGLITGTDRIVFEQIAMHETKHAIFLKNQLGSNAIAEPTFDFTANGMFNPFGDYQQFLALSQAFEDTGVRAYKGQAGIVKANPDVLQAALQIHSVEALHASKVRRMRGLKGWISNNEGGLPSVAAQAEALIYGGEEATTQAGFNTATVALRNGASGPTAGSESFDEPITADRARQIATPFIG